MRTIYDSNMEKIKELTPSAIWAVESWMNDCIRLGHDFRIVEAYRSQERQNYYYAQGRTRPGKIVTWTLSSKHTQRLALDILPIYPFLGKKLLEFLDYVAFIGESYGIFRNAKLLELGDYGHFEVDKAKQKPKPDPKSPSARKRLSQRNIRSFQQEISQSVGDRKKRLQKRLDARPHS